jgi:hypothetical protein
MSLGNCHFATDKNTFYIREIAFGDFRLYSGRFKSEKVYTGEDLKPHPVGVLCFKSLTIPLL